MTATEQLADWDLIVATLYWKGTANRILPQQARNRIWSHADGYGKMSGAQLAKLELLEDWSHIRDSSDEAQARVAESIRIELKTRDNMRAMRFGAAADEFQTHEAMVAEIVAKLGARA